MLHESRLVLSWKGQREGYPGLVPMGVDHVGVRTVSSPCTILIIILLFKEGEICHMAPSPPSLPTTFFLLLFLTLKMSPAMSTQALDLNYSKYPHIYWEDCFQAAFPLQ